MNCTSSITPEIIEIASVWLTEVEIDIPRGPKVPLPEITANEILLYLKINQYSLKINVEAL